MNKGEAVRLHTGRGLESSQPALLSRRQPQGGHSGPANSLSQLAPAASPAAPTSVPAPSPQAAPNWTQPPSGESRGDRRPLTALRPHCLPLITSLQKNNENRFFFFFPPSRYSIKDADICLGSLSSRFFFQSFFFFFLNSGGSNDTLLLLSRNSTSTIKGHDFLPLCSCCTKWYQQDLL